MPATAKSTKTTFTFSVGRTAIYIALAATLFLASFVIAANAQTYLCSSSGGCAVTTSGTISNIATYSGYPTQQPKENQHLWIWKWLAMLGTFGGGIFCTFKAFESFQKE